MLMPGACPIGRGICRKSGSLDAYGPEIAAHPATATTATCFYGPTNEELITDILPQATSRATALPLTPYHIQWKFRDEIRPATA